MGDEVDPLFGGRRIRIGKVGTLVVTQQYSQLVVVVYLLTD